MTDIGTSQARRLAADDVLFMQQITGDTEVVFKDMLRMRSPLSGYFCACEEASGERGGAEDFSLTRGISAAELTHIDHMSVSG
ncbi:MAG: hypothetical protein ACLRS8_06940 [Parabacteroides merdae]